MNDNGEGKEHAAMKNNDKPIRSTNNPWAPDVFADDVTGIHILNGVLRVVLEAWRVDYSVEPPTYDRICLGRLTMPPATAKRLADCILFALSQQTIQPVQHEAAAGAVH